MCMAACQCRLVHRVLLIKAAVYIDFYGLCTLVVHCVHRVLLVKAAGVAVLVLGVSLYPYSYFYQI